MPEMENGGSDSPHSAESFVRETSDGAGMKAECADIPVEIRHLMRAACYECIAHLVVQYAAEYGRSLDEWINVALQGFIVAGERAGVELQNLSLEDCHNLQKRSPSMIGEDGELMPLSAEGLAALEAGIRKAKEQPSGYRGRSAESATVDAIIENIIGENREMLSELARR